MANTRIISRRKVTEACQRYLDARRKYVEKERESLIVERLKPKWYRRALTREEAIVELKAGEWNDKWYTAAYRGSRHDLDVERLLTLAQATDDYVDSNNDQYEYMTIDDETTSILEDWWD